MEDRALKTNQKINKQKQYLSAKVEYSSDKDYLWKENWKKIDDKVSNQLRNCDKLAFNSQPKAHFQSYQICGNQQINNGQTNYNKNLKQSYCYEQTRPQTEIYQTHLDKFNKMHSNFEDRQKFDQQIANQSDKYLQKQSGQSFGNRTPVDPRANINSNTPFGKNYQNQYKGEYKQSDYKNDHKQSDNQRIQIEFTKNKTNLNEITNSTKEEKGFLDIEKRLLQRREQAEKLGGQCDGKLNYYSKSQEYPQSLQKTRLENSEERIKQFQKDIRMEIQERLKEQSNQYKIDKRNLDLYREKQKLVTDFENKQRKNEILEIDQFKFTSIDDKFKIQEKKNNYDQYSRQDNQNNLKRYKFDEKSPHQSKFEVDFKQQKTEFGQYHFNQKQEFDINYRQQEKIKFIDRSLQQEKLLNEEKIKNDLKSEGSTFKESSDKLFKEQYNFKTKQQYQTKRENNQSQEIQRGFNLLDKLQKFNQEDNKRNYNVQKQQNNILQITNYKNEANIYNQKQSTQNRYNFNQFEIRKKDEQFDKITLMSNQFQYEKNYEQLKQEMSIKLSEFDNKKEFENRIKPELIQNRIGGTQEYRSQKYQSKDQYKPVQKHSYHEELSIYDRLGLEKGNNRDNINNKAIEDILQGTALSKYIEREKNQNRISNFNHNKVTYQKSPQWDKEFQLGHDRFNQNQKNFVSERYVGNENIKRQPTNQYLQQYCSPIGLIIKQFGNYDIKDRRI